MSINDKFYQKLKVTENGTTVWKQFTYREIAETKLYNKYVETKFSRTTTLFDRVMWFNKIKKRDGVVKKLEMAFDAVKQDNIAKQKERRMEEARKAAARIAEARKAEEARIREFDELYQKIISTPGPEYVAYIQGVSDIWYYVGEKYPWQLPPPPRQYSIYNGSLGYSG